MKRLSKEIKLANNAQIQIEEIDISFRANSESSSDKGKIKMHNKKNANANQDLFVLNKYPLLSLNKNKKNNLVNINSLDVFNFFQI